MPLIVNWESMPIKTISTAFEAWIVKFHQGLSLFHWFVPLTMTLALTALAFIRDYTGDAGDRNVQLQNNIKIELSFFISTVFN